MNELIRGNGAGVPPLERPQAAQVLGVHGREPAGEDGLNEACLGAEMVIDAARFTPASLVMARMDAVLKP